MAKTHSRGIGRPKAGSDAGNNPYRVEKSASSRSLEMTLLGLLSICVGVLLLLFLFR